MVRRKVEEEYESIEESESGEDEVELPPPIKGKTCSFPYVDLHEIAREELLCKSTVIYGESGDGKSYIANTLLNALSPYVNITFVFCPTARVDKSFPMVKYTSPLFTFEVLDMKRIKDILDYGCNRMAMLRDIEDPERMSETVEKFILPYYRSVGEEKLFNKTKRGYSKIRKFNKQFDTKGSTKAERDEHDHTLVKMYQVLMYLCKNYMYKNRVSIPSKYKELAMPVLFFDINPYNIILTNDFGDILGAQKKEDGTIASEMVMKERHYGITTIHLIQSVNHIKKSDRMQIKVNIFASALSITTYVTTVGIKGPTKKRLEEAAEIILNVDRSRGNKRRYPVVIYFKLTDTICYTYADPTLDVAPIGNEKLYKKLEDYSMSTADNNPLADIFKNFS